MPASRFLLVGALVLAVWGAGGCVATTIDPTVTEAPAAETSTTLPSGTAADLLPRLVSEVAKLSEVIGGGGKKSDQLLVITNLFDAVRPDLADTDGVAALEFDGAIELCKKATQFNRPADADKCLRNLTALTDSFLASNS